MKKLMVVLAAGMVAAGAQAAVMNWGVAVLADSVRGTPYYGTDYANAGTDVYLVYNGIGNSDPVTSVGVDGLGNLVINGGLLVTATVTDGADAYTGGISRQEAGVDLNWPADPVGTWEEMNNKTFSLIAVTDDDGFISDDGMTWYGIYTGNATSFSTASGASSIGSFGTALVDAGSIQIVPEPATIGLMGIAGLGMFLARRKVRA